MKPGDRRALTAHIDFFPTLAEIGGATLSATLQTQIEGRSLVPLLIDPAASWPDRVLFTHVGRWPKAADPGVAKYRACSVRTTRWHLVSPGGGWEPRWRLFDVQQDYSESSDLKSQHPDVVRDLSGRFDAWWDSLGPFLVNEDAVGPAIKPFKEQFWRQFGGAPSSEDLRLMDLKENPATRPPPFDR